ncbi:hypothetical protein AAG906_027727 [Vitis piasezkii]
MNYFPFLSWKEKCGNLANQIKFPSPLAPWRKNRTIRVGWLEGLLSAVCLSFLSLLLASNLSGDYELLLKEIPNPSLLDPIIEASRGSFSRAWISRPITPRIVEKDNDKDTGSSKSSHPWHESLEASLRARSISESSFSEFRRIQYFDAEQRIKESQDLKHPVKRFVIDVETTGFCRETGWIIEIAILDLPRDKNSYFQALVKPEQHVPNSFLHGITTQMVNESNVPRTKDLIPILMKYVKSRP